MDSWLQEYEELMFGKNHTKSTMDAAAELKYNHMPDVLYKYRQVSDNSLNALENDFLVFSGDRRRSFPLRGSYSSDLRRLCFLQPQRKEGVVCDRRLKTAEKSIIDPGGLLHGRVIQRGVRENHPRTHDGH